MTGNSASANLISNGGGINSNGGALTITHSTIVNNSGMFFNTGLNARSKKDDIKIYNSIISGHSDRDLNISITNSYLPIEKAYGNLVGTSSFGSGIEDGVNGNMVGIDPQLSPLTPPSQSIPKPMFIPMPGSIVIGSAHSNYCQVYDKRYLNRDLNRCDIGSVEFKPSEITVTTHLDNPDWDASMDVAGCSLREAVVVSSNGGMAMGGCAVNPHDGGGLIDFDPLLTGETIDLLGQEITIDGTLVEMDASEIGGMTIDANRDSRVLKIENSNVAMNQLSVQGGIAFNDPEIMETDELDGSGGGIYINRSNVVLNDSTVSGSYAQNGYGGGGVYALDSLLELNHSTVSGNTSSSNGGGIYIGENGRQGVLTMNNSTVSGNKLLNGNPDSTPYGSGIQSNYGSPSIILKDSTVASNSGNYSVYAISLTLQNSIIAGTRGGGDDCGLPDGNVISTDAYSIIQDGSCFIDGEEAINARNGNPRLEPLADNGGFTRTHALNKNSIARDTGDNANCPDVDQRGNDRFDMFCDVGAVEYTQGDVTASNFIVIPLSGGKVVVIPN